MPCVLKYVHMKRRLEMCVLKRLRLETLRLETLRFEITKAMSVIWLQTCLCPASEWICAWVLGLSCCQRQVPQAARGPRVIAIGANAKCPHRPPLSLAEPVASIV